MIERFERPDGMGPVNGYSHVVAGTGRLVAVSGQLPVDDHGALVGDTDALLQARQVFANVRKALAAAGADARALIRLGVFLVDLNDLPAYREARDEFLNEVPAPASSLVQVARLVLPGARLEVDALALTEG